MSKKQKQVDIPPSEDTSHVLGILSSLFTNIASDSPERIRLLAKFVENNYEKVDKLLELRDNAHGRLTATDVEIERERKVCNFCYDNISDCEQDLIDQDEEIESEEDLWYLRRLDGGLYTLQMVDYILAWIAMEDDGVRVSATSFSALLTTKDPGASVANVGPKKPILAGHRQDIANISRQCR